MPLLPGWLVYHAIVDPRDGTLYAATSEEAQDGIRSVIDLA